MTVYAGEYVRNTLQLLVGVKTCTALWKSVWFFLRKLGNNLPQDPPIPLLGKYPEDVLAYLKDMWSTMLITGLYVIARTWKQPKCPSTEE